MPRTFLRPAWKVQIAFPSCSRLPGWLYRHNGYHFLDCSCRIITSPAISVPLWIGCIIHPIGGLQNNETWVMRPPPLQNFSENHGVISGRIRWRELSVAPTRLNRVTRRNQIRIYDNCVKIFFYLSITLPLSFYTDS